MEVKTIKNGQLEHRHRFKDACNDIFEIASLDDLTPEALGDFIRLHGEVQRPRLDELDDYYEVKNPTIFKRKAREAHLSDVRLAHGYARYISSFIQGYLVGTPIKVKHPDDDINEAVQELNKQTGADKLNSDITLDLSIYGRAYDMVYRNSRDQDRVVRLNPLQTFVIYDDTVEARPIAGVRYKTGRDGKIQAEVFTDHKVIYYVEGAAGLIEDRSEEHFFQEVPITEYANNRFRQGDFEPVLDLIDAYDAAESDMSNYMTDINDAMLVISGRVSLDEEKAKRMKDHNLLLLIPPEEPDGNAGQMPTAGYIYKQYDVTGVEAYKDRLQADIHRFTNTPDMSDEKFSGQASGESMKYKLFGLDQVRADKETKMTEGLSRRYRLLFNIKSTAQELTGASADDLEFIFTPNVPRAFYEELKAFIEAGGQLSQETLLTLTALVPDAKEELKKLGEEQGEGARMPVWTAGEDLLLSQMIARGGDEGEPASR